MLKCVCCPNHEGLGLQDHNGTLDDLRALGVLKPGEVLCNYCIHAIRWAEKRRKENTEEDVFVTGEGE